VTDIRQYPLRGISLDAGSLKSLSQQNRKTWPLLAHLHDTLGVGFWAYGCMPKLWRTHCLPFHAWFCRGSLLCKFTYPLGLSLLNMYSLDAFIIYHVGIQGKN
jgi:hypothetical protein